MPPQQNTITYEEFYSQQLWAIEYLENRSKFAETTLPIAWGLSKSASLVLENMPGGLKGIASKQGSVQESIQKAFDQANDLSAVQLEFMVKERGFDNINLAALKSISDIYQQKANDIHATILSEVDYYAQRDALSNQAWEDYYQGRALQHIHTLESMLADARAAEQHYYLTAEALEADVLVYERSSNS